MRQLNGKREGILRLSFAALVSLTLIGCELANVALIGADYMGLNPKTQADKAAAKEMIQSCQNNPSGYAKKDGVTTATPCSKVLAAYHQAVLQHCHKYPNRNVDVNGASKPCSEVFEEERQAVAAQCSKNPKGYATVYGSMQPCSTASK